MWPCASQSGSKSTETFGTGDVLGEGGEDLVLPETVQEVAGVAHGRRF